eukprot:IDg10793t1
MRIKETALCNGSGTSHSSMWPRSCKAISRKQRTEKIKGDEETNFKALFFFHTDTLQALRAILVYCCKRSSHHPRHRLIHSPSRHLKNQDPAATKRSEQKTAVLRSAMLASILEKLQTTV